MSRLTRNLIIALVASVLLNVFVAGLWAGRLVKGGHRGRGLDALDVDADASGPMRRVWRTHDTALRPKSEAVVAARTAVRDALVAEPFNPEAMESALSQLRTETNGAQVALHHALVDAARELNLEDRRRMAASRWFLRSGPRRMPGMPR
jgi:uncharacterized membrane protein